VKAFVDILAKEYLKEELEKMPELEEKFGM
jgi:hypothetical protein